MRDRLIASFVLVAMFILLIFGIARAYSVKDLVQHSEELKVQRSVALVSTVIAERQQNGESISADYVRSLLGPAERAVYTAPDGHRLVAAAADFPKGDSSGAVSQTLGVRGGGTVTLSRSQHIVDQTISDALLPVVWLAFALIAVAALLGYLASLWLSRPFVELARVARELGRGRFDVQVSRFSIPEADTVGRALQTSASQLQAIAVRERQFASNASHQLRTPITALRLELEDLSLWKETPAPVADQLNRAMRELDRLADSVTNLLELARGRGGVTTDVDLSELAEEAVARWEPEAANEVRQLSVVSSGPLRLRLAPGPIEQILDVLLDNALQHGAGAVVVEVSEFEGHARLRVLDEGRLKLSDELFRRQENRSGSESTTLGLVTAAEIADALGGHLTLDRGSSTAFSLMLPKV